MRHSTYKGILKGDRIEWIGEAPDIADAVPVQVTVLEQPAALNDEERRRRILETLNALAARNAGAAFGDPLEWQRETRKDRPLPGRED
jgi:hypothetical protein